MQLDDIIEKSYSLFQNYTIGKSLNVCKCDVCVSDEAEAELVNTSLREVSSVLLEKGYYNSARLFSEKELREMKHFLPRVLELVSNFDFPCHSPEIVFSRLDFDQTEKWTKDEVQLLTDFSVLYFKKCLTYYPDTPGYHQIDTFLVMFGHAPFDLKPILTEWENTNTIESLLHFKDFVFHGLKYKSQLPIKLINAFSDKFVDKTILDWLNNKTLREKFSTRIERAIMNNENLSEKNANELSWIYELLTN